MGSFHARFPLIISNSIIIKDTLSKNPLTPVTIIDKIYQNKELLMDTLLQTQTDVISLTSNAAEAVKDLMIKKDLQGYALRVFISGGGCSGFQYGMALDNNVREQDLVIDTQGVRVLVDEVSIQYLRGASVDYVDELMGSGFKISNPNAVSSCGCGQSFRTADSEAGSGSCGCH